MAHSTLCKFHSKDVLSAKYETQTSALKVIYLLIKEQREMDKFSTLVTSNMIAELKIKVLYIHENLRRNLIIETLSKCSESLMKVNLTAPVLYGCKNLYQDKWQNNNCTSYTFDQVGCGKMEFQPQKKKKQEGDKINLGMMQMSSFPGPSVSFYVTEE